MNRITTTLQNKKESSRLCRYNYSTNIGFDVEVLTIGADTQIKATPPVEVGAIAPDIVFFSKENSFLKMKDATISSEAVPIFAEWVGKASKLLEHIYEHYDDLVCLREYDEKENA